MDHPINAYQQSQLSIEQFLRAAKLLEKHAIENLLIGHPQKQMDPMLSLLGAGSAFSSPFLAKFGEEYQDRLFVGKMRQNANINGFSDSGSLYTPNSTGTSRRSSPLSAAPSPNSPRFCSPTEPTTPTSSSFSSASPILYDEMRGNFTNPSSSSNNNNSLTPPTQTSARNGGGGGGGRGANRQSRAAHNELEKNRRANLRGHLEALKAALPAEPDSQRDTTLSLLTRARNFIRLAKEAKGELMARRAALLAENARLQEQQQKSKKPNVSEEGEKIEVLLPMPKACCPPLAPPCSAQLEKPNNCPAPAHFEFSPESKMAKPNMDLLEMQGLAPLLPQLYPYNYNQQTVILPKMVMINDHPFPSPNVHFAF